MNRDKIRRAGPRKILSLGHNTGPYTVAVASCKGCLNYLATFAFRVDAEHYCTKETKKGNGFSGWSRLALIDEHGWVDLFEMGKCVKTLTPKEEIPGGAL